MREVLEAPTPQRLVRNPAAVVRRWAATGVAVIGITGFAGITAGARAQDMASRYDVRDVMIPMRDGVRLHTKIFTPKDATGPLPFIMKRTPYGVEGAAGNLNGYMSDMAEDGYIFVFQDIRGKYGSEGTFVMQRPACPEARPRPIRMAPRAGPTREPASALGSSPASTRAPTPTTPSSGCCTTCRATTAASACWASPTTAGPRSWRALRAAPGAEGDLAAGLARRHVAGRRLPPQRRVPPELRLRVRGHDGDRARRRSSSPSTATTPTTGTCQLGPLANVERGVPARHAFPPGTTTWRTPTTTTSGSARRMIPYITAVKVPTLNVAGWWDQEDFYGPVRIYEALEQFDTATPATTWSSGRGTTAAGHEARATRSARSTSAATRRSTSVRTGPGALVRVLAEGRGYARPAGGAHVRGGQQRVAALGRVAAKARRRAAEPVLPALRSISRSRPPLNAEDAFDSYVCDPAHPVPYRHRPVQETYGPRLDLAHLAASRTSASSTTARTCCRGRATCSTRT